METQALYNAKEPASIEEFARKLMGHTFEDVITMNIEPESLMVKEQQASYYSNKARKGGLAIIVMETVLPEPLTPVKIQAL